MSVDSAAKILRCMKDDSAAEILGCMKDVNNKFDSNSVAEILGCMKDANNKFDNNSVAKILQCMYALNAAQILQLVSNKKVAAEILQCMIDKKVAAGILGCMNDEVAAEILGCMSVVNAAEILECMKDANNAAEILVFMDDDIAAQILVCMKDDVYNTIEKCVNDIRRIPKEQLKKNKDDKESKERSQGDADQLSKKDGFNTTSNSKGKKIKLEISMIFVAVLLIVIEAVITVLSIKSSLKNGYVMNNRMVINKIITAASTMLMMISVVIYVMSKNRSVLYDIIMIGCNALLMVMRICTVFMSNYVNVISIVMIVISVGMIITSIVVIIDPKINKGKNNESKKSGEKNGNGKGIMTKNAILIGFTCVMILSGWIAQVMDMNSGSQRSYSNRVVME
ncbi:hypothetical protein OCOL_000713 [Ordospora colligata]